MTDTIKAVRIHSHGGPEVMRLEDIALPPPGPGEARLRHTAIALNFSDINVRRGGFYQKDPLPMPIILGNEAAGVVDGAGPRREGRRRRRPCRLLRGRRQFLRQYRSLCGTTQRTGGAAGETAARYTDQQAVALMLKGLTASSIVNRIYRPKPGDTILIHAAASGVGLLLAQWSKHLGAAVIGTVGNANKAGWPPRTAATTPYYIAKSTSCRR